MKKTTMVLTVLAWLIFGFLVVMGVVWTIWYIPAGLIILLAAVLILPPTGLFLKRYRIKGWMRGTACLVLATVGLYIAGQHLPEQQTVDTIPAAVGESVFTASSEPAVPEPIPTEVSSEPPMAGYSCAGKIEFDSFDVKEALISFTVSEDYTAIGDITVTLKELSTIYTTATGKSKIEMERTSVTYNGSNPIDVEGFAIPLGNDGMLYGTINEDSSFSGSIDYTYTHATPSFTLPLGRGDWVATLPESATRYQFSEESSAAESIASVGQADQTESAAGESSAAGKKALDYPATGVLTDNGSGSGFGLLRINTAAGNPTYIKIYSAGGAIAKTLFIRSGESLQIDLDQGSYVIKYASGEKWYGEKEMFGENGVYQKADTVLDYSQSGAGYELTLKSVVGGNLGSIGQNKNSF